MTDTNEIREALANCPFCGGEAMFQEEHYNHWRVVCSRCGVRHPYLAAHRVDPRPELVAAWNRRNPDRLSAPAPVEAEPMAYRYVHLDYAGRKVSRYGAHPERVNGHDPIEVHPLYAHPPTPTVAADQTRLMQHFQRMMEAAANYLEPTTYVARRPVDSGIGLCKWNTEFPMPEPTYAPEAVKAITDRRDQAFINDIIYMLDGPEQRAALAAATNEPAAHRSGCSLQGIPARLSHCSCFPLNLAEIEQSTPADHNMATADKIARRVGGRFVPNEPAADQVEAVARAIEPAIWARFDNATRPYIENRGANRDGEQHWYALTYKAGCRSVEDVKRWLENCEPAYATWDVHAWRESWVKARAAIAALSQSPAVEERESIVAWLRNPPQPDYSKCEYPEDYAITRAGAAIGQALRDEIADAISRGEHKERK